MNNKPARLFNLEAIRPDGLSFVECALNCANNADLVREFDRLYGANLTLRGTPLELEIDKASGKLADDLETFLNFVWETVYTRLPLEQP